MAVFILLGGHKQVQTHLATSLLNLVINTNRSIHNGIPDPIESPPLAYQSMGNSLDSA